MGIEIRGKDGQLLEVSRLGRAKVLAVSQSSVVQNALVDARTWTCSATVTPTGASDYFFFLRNDSGLRDIVISRVYVDAGTTEQVALHVVTGTPVGGTTLTPLNRTRGSAKLPLSATIQSGVDITGLTAGGTLERLRIVTTNTTSVRVDLMDRPVVLKNNQAVALLATVGAIALNFQVDIWENLTDPQVVT